LVISFHCNYNYLNYLLIQQAALEPLKAWLRPIIVLLVSVHTKVMYSQITK